MDSVYDTPVVLDTLGRSDHRMVLLKPSCDARLDTGNIQRAVVRRFTTNEKAAFSSALSRVMVYSVPTGQVVPTSGQVVDSTCECSGVSTTDFYQLTGSVQLKLLNDRCSTKLPLPRNPPLLEM